MAKFWFLGKGIQATGISQKMFQIKLLISSFAALLVLISIILIWFFPTKGSQKSMPCDANNETELVFFVFSGGSWHNNDIKL